MRYISLEKLPILLIDGCWLSHEALKEGKESEARLVVWRLGLFTGYDVVVNLNLKANLIPSTH